MKPKTLNCRGKFVLILGDLHIPFHQPGVFDWLKLVVKHYKLTPKNSVIMSIGDEVTLNTYSFHQRDPDIPYSPSSELQECIDIIHQKGGLYEMFPKMYLCSSNHGDLIYRRAKWAQLPLHTIKSYAEILQVKGWQWHHDYMLKTDLGTVYVHHGRGKIGKVVSAMQSSACAGHYHSEFGIWWYGSPSGDRFGAQVGSLCDQYSLDMEYGKLSTKRPLLGSLLLGMDGTPHLLKMPVDKNNNWTGKLQ